MSTNSSLRGFIVNALVALLLPIGVFAQPATTETPPSADGVPAAGFDAAIQQQTRALARASSTVVGVRSMAVDDAVSNRTLGRKREGSGVLIDDDGSLVLTIGYLIIEAEQVEIEIDDGRVFPARVVAYDTASGFGLVRSLTPLPRPATVFGSAAGLAPNQPMLFVSGGAEGELKLTYLASQRPFTGYWEYHIEDALFTVPALANHSGAGLFNSAGELLGIGSLLVRDALGPDQPPQTGNMFVPVDLLRPILAELRESGRSMASQRAWLGVNCAEVDGKIRITRITTDGPADAAGLLAGDQILAIDSVPVSTLPTFYQRLWAGPTPNREVSVDISRNGALQTIKVQATDRLNSLRHASGI